MRIELEWRHLDKNGNTCERCSETGEEVHKALEELKAAGQEISLVETLLDEGRIPESNLILINGVPIEDILPGARKSKNCCESCGDLLGSPTLCRIIEIGNTTHETIPASLIKKAVELLSGKQDS